MTVITDIQNDSRNYQQFTVTIAAPGVFTCVNHGLLVNDRVVLSTTGALPTGLSEGSFYYVIAAGLDTDTFELSATKGGTAITTTGSQNGTHYVAALKNPRFTVRNTGGDSNK